MDKLDEWLDGWLDRRTYYSIALFRLKRKTSLYSTMANREEHSSLTPYWQIRNILWLSRKHDISWLALNGRTNGWWIKGMSVSAWQDIVQPSLPVDGLLIPLLWMPSMISAPFADTYLVGSCSTVVLTATSPGDIASTEKLVWLHANLLSLHLWCRWCFISSNCRRIKYLISNNWHTYCFLLELKLVGVKKLRGRHEMLG